MIEVTGTYQDGQSSHSEPAQLSAHGAMLTLRGDGWRKTLAAAEVSISDRVGQIPRRLQWPSGEVFVCKDNDAVDQLALQIGGKAKSDWVHRLESSLPMALAGLVLVVVIYVGALFWGVPAGARYLAFKVPDSVRAEVAQQTLAVMDRSFFEQSTLPAERSAALREYLHSFDSYPQQILFRAGEDIGANAMALPGDVIVITDELVKLADHDAEILAVYLHEVGHAKARHSETMILQSSAWLVILAMATGDISGVSEAIFTFPVTLGQMAFSRGLELEADDYAIDGLLAAELNPELLATMLNKLTRYDPNMSDADDATAEQPHNEPVTRAPSDPAEAQPVSDSLANYLSTHPATAERVERIRAAAFSARPSAR